MKSEKDFRLIFFLVWILLTPSMAQMINVSATGLIETEVQFDSDAYQSGSIWVTDANTEVVFSVTATSTTFVTGNYWISGLYNETGTYTDNSILNLSSSTDGTIMLTYRATGTSTNESNQSLTIRFDLSAPSLQLTSVTQSLITSNSNMANLSGTIATNGRLQVSCSDTSGSIEQLSIRNSTGSLIAQTNQSSLFLDSNYTLSNQTIMLFIHCEDRSSNLVNKSLFLFEDAAAPVIQLYPSSPISTGQCLPSSWYLSSGSTDNSPPTIIQYSLDEKATWSTLPSPFTPRLNFSGSLYVKATDAVGNFNISSLNISDFDQNPPEITLVENTNQSQVQIHFSDDCGQINSGTYRYQFSNGTYGNWISVQNGSTIVYPTGNSQISHRLEIKATDSDGRTSTNTTNWSGAMSTFSLNLLNSMKQVGNYFGKGGIRFTVTPPTGGSFTSSANITDSNGSVTRGLSNPRTSATTSSYPDLNSGTIVIAITTTDNNSNVIVQTYSYIIDAEVTSQPILTVSGDQVMINGTRYIGPSSQISLSNLVDSGGIGFDYVECTWVGSGVMTNHYIPVSALTPPGAHGSETPNSLKCRNIDKLGNQGPFKLQSHIVDRKNPIASVTQEHGGSIITNSTKINASSIDSILNGTSTLQLDFVGSPSNWTTNITFNGSWNGAIRDLNANLTEGTLKAKILASDWFGNSYATPWTTWQLNSSMSATILDLNHSSIINVGNYYGDFLRFTANPPPSSSFTITVEHSNYVGPNGGNWLGGYNTSQFTQKSWSYASLNSGIVYANVTTTDSFNRSIINYYTYQIDADVTSTPSVNPSGNYYNHNGSVVLGPGGKVSVTNIAEQYGVGTRHVDCFEGNNTVPRTFQSATSFNPTVTSGVVEQISIKCRIIDLIGNAGPFKLFTAISDLLPPQVNTLPISGATIGPTSTLIIQSNDSILNGSSEFNVSWSNTTSNWSTVVQFNGSWQGTLSSLNSSLGDGVISIKIIGRDWLGNTIQPSTITWTLNTSTSSTSLSLNGSSIQKSGSYIGNYIRFTAVPPSGGGFTATVEQEGYTNNQGTNRRSNINLNTTALSWSYQGMSSGKMWVNITTIDSFGRSISDHYVYEIDGDVTSVPVLVPKGNYIYQSQIPFLGAGGGAELTNFMDAGGAGAARIDCWLNNASSATSYLNTSIIPIAGQTGIVSSFALGCQIIDLLGNHGEITWFNGSIDLLAPTVQISPLGGSTISSTSTISIDVHDSILNGTSSVDIEWYNSSQNWSTTILFNGSLSKNLGSLNSSLGEGTIVVRVLGKDWFGNSILSNSYTWSFNTTTASTSLYLNSTSVQSFGNYYGDFIRFTAIPPSGSTFTVTIEHSNQVGANGGNWLGGFNSSQPVQRNWSYANLSSGVLYANVTTTDAFNRSITDRYTFLIDADVTSTPTLNLIGNFLNISGNLTAGSTNSISISNLQDQGGAGADFFECYKNESSSAIVYSNSFTTSIQGTWATVSDATIKCRIVDVLGNRGTYAYLNFTLDLQPPTTTTTPASGSIISPSTTIEIHSNDSILNGTSVLYLSYTNGLSTWNNTVSFNGTWNGQIGTLNSSLGDGNITLYVQGEDWFGNQIRGSTFTYQYSTTPAIATYLLDTANGMKQANGYIGNYARILITPPNQGSFTYTLVHDSAGELHNNSTGINTPFIAEEFSLQTGNLWLNITSTDSFSRVTLSRYMFTVDSSVTTLPMLSLNINHLVLNSTNFIGPNSEIQISNITDTGGVGSSHAECFTNGGQTSTQYSNLDWITPQGVPGSTTSYSLKCRNVDLFGNIGMFSWLNASIDLEPPSSSLTPQDGQTIILSTLISVEANDTSLNGTSELVIHWSNGTNQWNGTINFNGSWTGTIGSLNGMLEGGNITAYVKAIDWFGNVQNSNVHVWQLNTTFLDSVVQFDLSSGMSSYGGYIGSSVGFIVTPPVGGSFTASVVHSNGTTIYINNTSQTTSLAIYIPNLNSGTVSLHITTTDVFGRSGIRSHVYSVDADVTSVPTLSATQGQIIFSGVKHLGPNDRIILSSLLDPGGVGARHAECQWNESGTSFTSQATNSLTPPGTAGIVSNFTLQCRIIDLLGNIGQYGWYNGSTDLQPPSVSLTPSASLVITPNSTLTAMSNDVVMNGSSELRLRWTNGANSWYQNITFNGTWSGSLATLNGGLTDGTVYAEVAGLDAFGNLVNTNPISWTLNTTATTTSVVLDTSQGMVHYNGYIGEDLLLSITPPLSGSFNYTAEHSIEGLIQSNSTSNYDFLSLEFTGLNQGTFWFNVTTVDAYGRITPDVYRFEVDVMVNTIPIIAVTSENLTQNGTLYTSGIANLIVRNLSDNPGGVGYNRTECRIGNGSITNLVAGSFTLSAVSSSMNNKFVECRNVDQLQNEGSWTNLSFIMDAKAPDTSGIVTSGSALGVNSSIAYTCTDLLPSFTQKISYSHQNQTQTNTGTLWLNGTQPSLSQLNLLTSGQLSLTYYCVDFFGNIGSSSVSGITYTDLTPYSEITFYGLNKYTAPDGIVYVGKNMSLEAIYMANNNGAGTINVSLFQNSTLVFSDNSTSSISLNLSNYTESSYRFQVESCSSLACSISQTQFVMDWTGPSTPAIRVVSNSTNVQANTTALVGRTTLMELQSVQDINSGFWSVTCQTSLSSFTKYSGDNMTFSAFLSALTIDNSVSNMICVSYDNVNNPSAQMSVLLDSDFVSPGAEVTINDAEGLAFPDTEFIIECTDLNPTSTALLTITGANGTIQSQNIAINTTYTMSDISDFGNASQAFTFFAVCSDTHNNSQVNQSSSIQYRPDVGGFSVTANAVIVNGTTTYIGNGSTINLVPQITTGNLYFEGYMSGTLIWQHNMSADENLELNITHWELMFSNTSPSAAVRLFATQTIEGTSSTSQVLIAEISRVAAPMITLSETGMKANGSLLFAAYSGHYCPSVNSSVFIEGIPFSGNLSVLQSQQTTSQGVNLTVPFGTNSSQHFEVRIEDCLGNTKIATYNVSRDLDLPSILVTGVRNGVVSYHRNLIVNVTDNSGIHSIEVSVSNYTNATLECTSTCMLQLPTNLNFVHNSTGFILVSVSTRSGESQSLNISFIVDDDMLDPSLSSILSSNQSGPFVGLHSNLTFITHEISSEFCLALLGSPDSVCIGNASSLEWDPPTFTYLQNFTVQLNATDLNGNTAQSFYTFTFVPQAPVLTNRSIKLDTPGFISVANNALVPFTITFDSPFNATIANAQLYVGVEGRYIVNATVNDALGYTRTQDFFILLDSTNPIVNLSSSSQSYIGVNSTLNLSLLDSISNISEYTITIVDGSISCSNTFLGASMNVLESIAIGNLLTPSCGLNRSSNTVLTISLETVNEVGRNTTVGFTTMYYGHHIGAYLQGSNITQDADSNLFVSPHSTFQCSTSHAVPSTSSLTIIGGNFSLSSSTNVAWNAGNATILCEQTDVLGNKWQGGWNIRFVSNDTIIQTSLLNNYNSITKFGYENLQINTTSSGTVSMTTIHLDQAPYSETALANQTLTFNSTEGNHTVSITVMTVHGYTQSAEVEFRLDGSAPIIEILNGSGYVYQASTKTLFMRSRNTTIDLVYSDEACGGTGTVGVTNATLSASTYGAASIAVNSTIVQTSVLITDCIGWSHEEILQIVRVNQPANEYFSNHSRFYQTNNSVFVNGVGAVQISFPGVYQHNITCSITIGTVDCSEISTNNWQITFQDVNSNGTLQIEVIDVLGNYKTIQLTLVYDTEGPECTFPGIIEFSNLFVTSLQNFRIQCHDDQTNVTAISLMSNNSDFTSHYLPNLTGDLVNQSQITIYAIDYFGNVFQMNLTVLQDTSGPLISCTQQNLQMSNQQPSYIRYSVTIECQILDTLSTITEVHLYKIVNENSSSLLLNSSTTLKMIQIPVGVHSHDTTLMLELQSEDRLGNLRTVTYHIRIDKIKPIITFESLDNNNQSITNPEVFHFTGEYLVHVNDQNNVESYANINCASGNNFQYEFSKKLEILQSGSDRLLCGSSGIIFIDTFDEAGNQKSAQMPFRIDTNPPQITFEPGCDTPMESVIILVPTCVVSFYSTDDTTSNQTVELYTNQSMLGSGVGTVDLDLTTLQHNVQYEILVVVTDEANREVRHWFTFIIQPNLEVQVSRSTCNSSVVSCNPSNFFEYDILLTGTTNLEFEIVSDPQPINVTTLIGTLCSEARNIPCQSINSGGTIATPDIDGYSWLNYSAMDSLGRSYSNSIRVLTQTSDAVIGNISSHPSPVGSTSEGETIYLVCETCAIEIKIEVAHQPQVKINIEQGDYSIESTGADGEWILKLNLSEEIVPKGNLIQVEITTASGAVIVEELNLQRLGQISITASLDDGTMCIDNAATLLSEDSERTPDFLCLFGSEALNRSTNVIELVMRVNSDHESWLHIEAKECFIITAIPGACQNTTHGPYVTGAESNLKLVLKSDSYGVWMEYQLMLTTQFSGEPIVRSVVFLERDDFASVIKVDKENTTIEVSESGLVKTNISIQASVTLSGHDDLNVTRYLLLLKSNIEAGQCSMAGSQYRILTDSLGGFNFVENIETGMVNCQLRVQLREKTLIIESEMDWSNHTEMSPPGSGLGLFYTYKVSNFQIEYELPFVNNTPPIFIDLDQQALFTSEDESTTIDVDVCREIFGHDKSLFQRVDSSKLQDCFNSFNDVEGLYGVGLEIRFEDRNGDELFTVRALCTRVPSTFDDWVSVRYYEQNDEECQQEKLEKIEDLEYDRIELRLFSCDVRCKMEAEASENHTELDNMDAVEYIKTTTENSRFKEIESNTGKVRWTVFVVIPVTILLVLINNYKEKVFPIVKNKLTKWQNHRTNSRLSEKENEG